MKMQWAVADGVGDGVGDTGQLMCDTRNMIFFSLIICF